MFGGWLLIAHLLTTEREQRDENFARCIEQTNRALNAARECNDVLGWCIDELRAGPRVEL